jgi:hypothetical protein
VARIERPSMGLSKSSNGPAAAAPKTALTANNAKMDFIEVVTRSKHRSE